MPHFLFEKNVDLNIFIKIGNPGVGSATPLHSLQHAAFSMGSAPGATLPLLKAVGHVLDETIFGTCSKNRCNLSLALFCFIWSLFGLILPKFVQLYYLALFGFIWHVTVTQTRDTEGPLR